MASVSNGLELEILGGAVAPFTVTFDCKPQRFAKDGSIPLDVIFAEGDPVVKSVFNSHSGTAKPVITIHKNQNTLAKISIGGKEISVFEGSPLSVVIDCESQNAYSYDKQNPENCNKYIYCEDFPVFEPGENIVVAESETATHIIIEPRWWDL